MAAQQYALANGNILNMDPKDLERVNYVKSALVQPELLVWILKGEEPCFKAIEVTRIMAANSEQIRLLDGNDAGWVLRAVLKSANFTSEQIARPVALSSNELDTLGKTLGKYAANHPVKGVQDIAKDLIAKIREQLKNKTAMHKEKADEANAKKKRKLDELEEQKRQLEEKMRKVQDEADDADSDGTVY